MATSPVVKMPIMRGRACRNCTGPIPKPKGNNQKKKVFCCDNCRKEFHKNNGISVHRLKEQVREWVNREILNFRCELGLLNERIHTLESRRRR